ncbi:snaclec botrocetin subunit alpha [Syngnathus scovelli]|uniref:snaclec botrocetin subunit alpha n=1 Tax=Syngnathus scovelli TaxID=161590 RepID=UPI00210F5E2B|nr:secretory phospholipase A2 receptor [Syngnathus scovelli]
MAFAVRLLFLLCVINGLLSGGHSFLFNYWKEKIVINNCPKGWTQFNCECYIFQAEGREFLDAESVCQVLGGNLVSIETALENIFVQGLIPEGVTSAWIGYNDQDGGGDYEWTDGTTPPFLNFDPPPSTSPLTSGECTVINEDDGVWMTVPCTDTEPYVCKKPVVH